MAHEWAQDADDVLWRRTKLGLRFSPEEREALCAFMAEASKHERGGSRGWRAILLRSTRGRRRRAPSCSTPRSIRSRLRSRNSGRSIRRPAWSSTIRRRSGPACVATVRDAMAKAGLQAKDIAGIGITNQRETTVIWDRATGKPIHNAIVWQDRRTADSVRASAQARRPRSPDFGEDRACCSIRIFPPPRSPGSSTTSKARARRAKAGRLAFGTIDTFLLWRLTGGQVHATDATNAARTLLLDIRSGEWDRRSGEAVSRCRCRCCRRCAIAPPTSARPPAVRRSDPHPRDRGRSAGRDHRAGLFQARHDEVDLRHRLLRAPQYRRHAGRNPATGFSPPSPTSSPASGPTRWRARSSSPAPPCNGCATASR